MSAGPVDKGKIPNMFECIICDPDDRIVERNALGLFYTALSRSTTLGDESGFGSAIYFSGSKFNESRVRNIGRMQNRDEAYKKVKERDEWVAYLRKNTRKCHLSKERRESVLSWAESNRVSENDLLERIKLYVGAKLNPTAKTDKRPIDMSNTNKQKRQKSQP